MTTTNDRPRIYKYDSFDMLTRVVRTSDMRRMIYDANDERIGMIVMSPVGEDTLSRWHIRDFGGRIIREYKGSSLSAWTWEQDHFYGEGGLIGGETQPWGFGCGTTDGYCWGDAVTTISITSETCAW